MNTQTYPNYNNNFELERTIEIQEGINDCHNSCRKVEEPVEPVNCVNPNQEEDCRKVEVVEATFALSDYLPDEIAEPLSQVAEAMPTSPEMLLTTLLPVCASLIGTAAYVQPWKGWKEPSIIWGMNVAPTGSMKSPTMDIITNPLWGLDSQDNEGREYIVDEFTMEALIQVHQDNPRGLLVCRDELDGLFKSDNKYRGGKGDDSQRWLSLHGGKPVKVNRKGSELGKLQLNKTAISITGTIQPRILENYLQGDNIHSGSSARWLFCKPDMPSAKYTGKDSPDVGDTLVKLYSALDSIPDGSIFVFSEDARDYFVEEWSDPIVEKTEQALNPAMEAVLAKLKGYCARIALVLHCIEAVTAVGSDSTELTKEIPLETIEKAVSLSYFYLNQAKSVYGVEEAQNSVPHVWEIIKSFSEERGGWVKAREVCQKTKRIKGADDCRKLFQEMAEDGFGKTKGEGKKLEWKYEKSLDITSTPLQNAESIAA